MLNVPLTPGKYKFTVKAAGGARYDLVFHDEGPNNEYRLTLNAPVRERIFQLDMPEKA